MTSTAGDALVFNVAGIVAAIRFRRELRFAELAQRLEQELGVPVRTFSYPVGQRDSFDLATLELADSRWTASLGGGDSPFTAAEYRIHLRDSGGNLVATWISASTVTYSELVRDPGEKLKWSFTFEEPYALQLEKSAAAFLREFREMPAIRAWLDARALSVPELVLENGSGLSRRERISAEGLGRLLGSAPKVAASRMAVEDGFTTHDYQVGQTGQTVQPRLYVAIGISGAVQHITGMQGSEIVVAINKDPKARIFNYADFGVVGDIETVVPELVRATEGRS